MKGHENLGQKIKYFLVYQFVWGHFGLLKDVISYFIYHLWMLFTVFNSPFIPASFVNLIFLQSPWFLSSLNPTPIMLKGYESFLIKNSKTNIQNKKKHLALGSQLRLFCIPKLHYQAIDEVFSLTQKTILKLARSWFWFHGKSSKCSLSIQRKHYKSTSLTIFKVKSQSQVW